MDCNSGDVQAEVKAKGDDGGGDTGSSGRVGGGSHSTAASWDKKGELSVMSAGDGGDGQQRLSNWMPGKLSTCSQWLEVWKTHEIKAIRIYSVEMSNVTLAQPDGTFALLLHPITYGICF